MHKEISIVLTIPDVSLQRVRYRELVEYCESRGIELPSRFLLPLEENLPQTSKTIKQISPGDVEVFFSNHFDWYD